MLHDSLGLETPLYKKIRNYAAALAGYGAMYGGKKLVKYGVDRVGKWMGSSSRKRKSIRTKRRRSSYSRNSTTTQRDTATKYVSRRADKSFLAFRKKVRAAIQADNPLCIYQSFLKGNVSSVNGFVARFGFYIADLNTTNQGDLWNIFKDAYGLAAASDAAGYKIYLKSACMDLQMRNTSTTADVWADVYELMCRSDLEDVNDPASQFATEFGKLADIGVTSVANPQVTPFQVPGFLRNWRVVRAKTYHIKRSDSVAMQVRRRMNRMINGADLEEAQAGKRKLTTAFLVLIKGTAGNTATDSGLLGTTVDYSVQLSYNYQEVTAAAVQDTIGQSK